MLHVTNGDSTAGSLRESALPGDVIVWADALYDGPVQLDRDPTEWRRLRARHHAASGCGTLDENLERLRKWDDDLDRWRDHDEVVFWFEHDLFDQLLLIRHLAWFDGRDLGRTELKLICVNEFPGVDRFIGLGQLRPDQLGSLWDLRRPIEIDQLQLGSTAWRAFGSPDPREIEQLIAGDTRPLPFLNAAFRRWLEEFPSVRDGLGRTECAALELLAEAPSPAGEIFVRLQWLEPAPFYGDISVYERLNDLSQGPNPLIDRQSASRVNLGSLLRLTESGRLVVEGAADAIQLNGINRWFGGVHISDRQSVWRWDAADGRLVHG
jgi:Domain of unknown function (DUF1835)